MIIDFHKAQMAKLLPTNEERARAARQALAAFPSDEDETATRVTDLIAHLGHLCDAEGEDFIEAVRMAIYPLGNRANQPAGPRRARPRGGNLRP